MSPDAPGNLAVLDLYFDSKATDGDLPQLRCHVERYDPTKATEKQFIQVSWYADSAQEGWVAVSDGVVHVQPPADYAHPPRYDAPVPRAGGRYFWRHPVHGVGLMLVAVLPSGYVIARAADADPTPDEVKAFENRMALYWWIVGPRRGAARWALTEVDAHEVDARCKFLLDEIKSPPRPRTYEI
jgi:hypothetical protein